MPRSRLFIWLLKKGFPLRTIFARFTRVPLLGRVPDYMLFHEDDVIYLPKNEVTNIKINQPIEQHGEMVVPSSVVEYFIEIAWIMDWCRLS